MERLLLLFMVTHVLAAPYTKVEESFNVQATHDILFYLFQPWMETRQQDMDTSNLTFMMKKEGQTGLAAFDHLDFPGVVPRTFIGSFCLAVAVYPFVLVAQALQHLTASESALACFQMLRMKLFMLYVVRLCLGAASLRLFCQLGKSVDRAFGPSVSFWFLLSVLCQFHLLFYMSRPLPNTFALMICCAAFSEWIRGSHQTKKTRVWYAVFLLTFCTVVFRCDVLILLGLCGIAMLLCNDISLTEAIVVGGTSALLSVSITCLVDTYFWTAPSEFGSDYLDSKIALFKIPLLGYRLIWPEGQVLIYNTLMNKSSNWGTMPFHWYFTSALPKTLLVGYPCFFLALLSTLGGGKQSRSILKYSFVCLGYVLLYSNLPHKETRFLFPVLPLYNLVAALGVAEIQRVAFEGNAMTWTRAGWKQIALRVLFLGIVMGYCLSVIISSAFLYVSSNNYPGGSALTQVHADLEEQFQLRKQVVDESFVHIHVGTYAAMTGVSRFVYLTSTDVFAMQQAALQAGKSQLSLVYSKKEEEDYLARLCSIKVKGAAGYDYLLMEESETEKHRAQCQREGYVISKQFHGDPRIDFRKASLVPQNSVIIWQQQNATSLRV